GLVDVSVIVPPPWAPLAVRLPFTLRPLDEESKILPPVAAPAAFAESAPAMARLEGPAVPAFRFMLAPLPLAPSGASAKKAGLLTFKLSATDKDSDPPLPVAEPLLAADPPVADTSN